VVVLAWPQESRLNMSANPEQAKNLINLFFLGQYLLVSLMAPSFAAAAIAGEKERRTYESLLATPLMPAAIVLGKLLASLALLAVLMITSLPIVMLCLPLGGVSLYEVLSVYLGLVLSVTLFGMISIACSSYFQSTAAALVVSYLLILPLAMCGILAWNAFGNNGELRLIFTLTVFPLISLALTVILFKLTCYRLLYPPDVGSEGKEVIDAETESREAVGLIISSERFLDSLFAPAKRTKLLPDGANGVYDKEMRSEMFAQGTLMLRLVIQVSVFIALPLMAFCLFLRPEWSAWYMAYVILFNMLVGPVFSAGAITSERERETLDLLLTTTLSPAQILWGKLAAGLRVSSVLTGFLLWPLLLAVVLNSFYWRNLGLATAYLVLIGMTSLTTPSIALFCSVLCRKTATAMMVAYLAIIALFCLPVALDFFTQSFFAGTRAAELVDQIGIISPFTTVFDVPFHNESVSPPLNRGNWANVMGYVSFTAALVAALWGGIIWLFHLRWRVAE